MLAGDAEEAATTLTEHLSRTRQATIERLTTGIDAGTFAVEIGPAT
ncbi:hypothetical protein [Actinopolyspora alba]|nr:hypothetical protein [Actinopolyspora alba]